MRRGGGAYLPSFHAWGQLHVATPVASDWPNTCPFIHSFIHLGWRRGISAQLTSVDAIPSARPQAKPSNHSKHARTTTATRDFHRTSKMVMPRDAKYSWISPDSGAAPFVVDWMCVDVCVKRGRSAPSARTQPGRNSGQSSEHRRSPKQRRHTHTPTHDSTCVCV